MIPPARFKAGEFVKSKKGELLKIIRSWQETEIFGLLAGSFKGWKYCVEDKEGRSLILRESVLFSCSDPDGSGENKTLPDESASIKPSEDTSMDEDWSLTQILQDMEGYDWHRRSKPLPVLGKRKCFQLSPRPSTSSVSSSKIASEMPLLKVPSAAPSLEVSESPSALKPPFSNDLDFDPGEDLALNKALDDVEGHEKLLKSKPVPHKRRCFSFSSNFSSAAPSSKIASELPVSKDSLAAPHLEVFLATEDIFAVPSPENSALVLLSQNSFSALPNTRTSTPVKSSPPAMFNLSPPPQVNNPVQSSASGSNLDQVTEQSVGRNIDPDWLPDSPPPVQRAPKTFLTAEEIISTTSKDRMEPKDSKRKSISIFDHFKNYIEERGVETSIAEISPKNLSHMLSSFWAERKKEDGRLHDVTTLHSEFSRLAATITRLTKNNPTTHPEFAEYRKTKEDKLAQSKQQFGNGQLLEQRDALDVEEISHFYQTGIINYGSGPGIVREFFLKFMLILNFRAVKDHQILKLGNIKIVRNSQGLIEYACYVSQWTKSDTGISRKGISKRGVIVPSSDRRTCFFTYYDVYMRMRAMLGPSFLEPESPFYLQPRLDGVDYHKTKNRCMFLPQPINDEFLKHIAQNMVIAAEIEVGDRKISNTSLRISSFHGQENLSIDAETGQSISGHISKATAATYRRKNQERQHNMGAGLMATFTNTPAVIPLTYGQKFKIKTNRQLTIVDTSSTIVDCTPQLLSMQCSNEKTSFKPGDKYPGISNLQPVILKLPSAQASDLTPLPHMLRQPPQPLADGAPARHAAQPPTADGVESRRALQEDIQPEADGEETRQAPQEEAFSKFGEWNRHAAQPPLADGVESRQAPQEDIQPAADGEETRQVPQEEAFIKFGEWNTSVLVDVHEQNPSVTNQLAPIDLNSSVIDRTSSRTTSVLNLNRNLAPTSQNIDVKSSKVSMKGQYNTKGLQSGSLVFAKVRGHKDPHWPAVITYLTESGYTVQFFGTNQIASMPNNSVQEDLLVPFSSESLMKYSNPRNLKTNKKRIFGEAFNKIVRESGSINVPSLLVSLPFQSKENVIKKLPGDKVSKKLSLGRKKKTGKENRELSDDLSDFDI